MPLEIGFTGTRKGMTPKQRASVDNILRQIHEWYFSGHDIVPIKVHQGDCLGSDVDFCGICRIIGRDKFWIICHPPKESHLRAFYQCDEWKPSKPYIDRNKDIVNGSEILIATPANQKGEKLKSGTWSTIRYAKYKDRRIFIVRPDGAIEDWQGQYPRRKTQTKEAV